MCGLSGGGGTVSECSENEGRGWHRKGGWTAGAYLAYLLAYLAYLLAYLASPHIAHLLSLLTSLRLRPSDTGEGSGAHLLNLLTSLAYLRLRPSDTGEGSGATEGCGGREPAAALPSLVTLFIGSVTTHRFGSLRCSSTSWGATCGQVSAAARVAASPVADIHPRLDHQGLHGMCSVLSWDAMLSCTLRAQPSAVQERSRRTEGVMVG